MIYKEETIAKDIFSSLKVNLKNHSEVDIQIKGRGVRWECYVSNQIRKCRINCFDYNNKMYKGAEYLLQFVANEKVISHGRTRNKSLAIESVLDWITNKTKLELYSKFYFIDEEKRALINFKQKLIESKPKLDLAQFEIYSAYDDIYELEIKNEDRECLINGKGINEPISLYFRVDNSEIFELEYKSDDFFEIIKMWIIDKSMPSEIENKFDYLNLGKIANFYDKGELLEGDFYNSWDKLERFFYFIFNRNFPLKYQIMTFVKSMRKDGLDKIFRAGQSMSILILTKSRRHGFNQEDPRMEFIFTNEVLKISFLNQNKMVKFKEFKGTYTQEVKLFIMELDKYEVN